MKHFKFDVGDTVTIKRDLKVGGIYRMSSGVGSEDFSERMEQFLGSSAIIVRATPLGYKIDIDSFHWYTDGMFENPEKQEEVSPSYRDSELADSLISHMLQLIPEQLINHALDTGNEEMFQEVTKKYWVKKD